MGGDSRMVAAIEFAVKASVYEENVDACRNLWQLSVVRTVILNQANKADYYSNCALFLFADFLLGFPGDSRAVEVTGALINCCKKSLLKIILVQAVEGVNKKDYSSSKPQNLLGRIVAFGNGELVSQLVELLYQALIILEEPDHLQDYHPNIVNSMLIALSMHDDKAFNELYKLLQVIKEKSTSFNFIYVAPLICYAMIHDKENIAFQLMGFFPVKALPVACSYLQGNFALLAVAAVTNTNIEFYDRMLTLTIKVAYGTTISYFFDYGGDCNSFNIIRSAVSHYRFDLIKITFEKNNNPSYSTECQWRSFLIDGMCHLVVDDNIEMLGEAFDCLGKNKVLIERIVLSVPPSRTLRCEDELYTDEAFVNSVFGTIMKAGNAKGLAVFFDKFPHLVKFLQEHRNKIEKLKRYVN